jgi:hypothetical protein
LRTFLTRARLATYVAEQPKDLRVGQVRVLGHFAPALGLVYIDTYYASDDDSVLRGTECVIRPGLTGGLRINYSGGFRPAKGLPLTAGQVFDNILKPCRRNALSESRNEQQGEVNGTRYRYCWTRMGSVEREKIAAWIDGRWVTVHEVIFEEESGKARLAL